MFGDRIMTKLRCSGTSWGLDRGVWGLGQDEAKDLARALRAGDHPVVVGNQAQHHAEVLRFWIRTQPRTKPWSSGTRPGPGPGGEGAARVPTPGGDAPG